MVYKKYSLNKKWEVVNYKKDNPDKSWKEIGEHFDMPKNSMSQRKRNLKNAPLAVFPSAR